MWYIPPNVLPVNKYREVIMTIKGNNSDYVSQVIYRTQR